MEGLFMLPSVVQQDWFLAKLTWKTLIWPSQSRSSTSFLLFSQLLTSSYRSSGFCLDSAPHPMYFQKWQNQWCSSWGSREFHSILYLDDLLLAATSREALMKDLATVVCLLMTIGFVINTAKSIMVPTHKMEFLGFVLDTREMAITLPKSKVNAIHRSLPSSVIRDRKLAHVIETPVVTKPAVSTTPLYFLALQHLKITSLHQHKSYQVRVSCLQRQWPTFRGGETTYKATAQLQSWSQMQLLW